MVIIFDVVGTLFSLDRVQEQFRREDLPPELFQLWFARLLQSAMAATMAGRYIPFRQAAESSLKQVLAVSERPQRSAEPILETLKELEPWPDAGSCLEGLRERGHRLAALTNSGAESAETLLRNAGLRELFDWVLSTDEAEACKPDPRPYRLALERVGCEPAGACLVAVHGWDVLGAASMGLYTVWVARLEKRWPFPGDPPGMTAPDLAGVPAAIDTLMA